MARPGSVITNSTVAPVRGYPTANVAFMVGLSDKGSTSQAVRVTSIADYISKFGARSGGTTLYDSVEVAFAEGAAEVYVARLVGPTPILATKTLSAGSLRVDADNAGAWGNSLSVAVLAGVVSGFRLQVSLNGITVETSPDLADNDAAVTWGTSSNYVNVVKLGSTNPTVVAAQALLNGTDDRANVVEGAWLSTSQALLPADLGPGRVLWPGKNTSTGLANLASFAAQTQRVAIGDLGDGNVSTLTTLSTAVRAAGNGDCILLVAGNVLVPGPVQGTTKTVPYSAAQAGLEGRRDQGDVSAVAAFQGYPFRTVLGFTTEPTDADRETLMYAGVNAGKTYYGSYLTYGYRSAADGAVNPAFVQFNAANLRMTITSRAKKIADAFDGEKLDALGHTMARFNSALVGMLKSYADDDSLYGDLSNPAALPFVVDTGPSVNTPATIADGQLKANIAIRISPFAELVVINISTAPITVSL